MELDRAQEPTQRISDADAEYVCRQRAEQDCDSQCPHFQAWLSDESSEPHALAVLRAAHALVACTAPRDVLIAELQRAANASRDVYIDNRMDWYRGTLDLRDMLEELA